MTELGCLGRAGHNVPPELGSVSPCECDGHIPAHAHRATLPRWPSAPRASLQVRLAHLGLGLDSSTGPSAEERSRWVRRSRIWSQLCPKGLDTTGLYFPISTVSPFQPWTSSSRSTRKN